MISKQNKTETFLWADVIRSGAIVLVIVIHVADLVVRKWQDVPDLWWHTANVFGSFARPAVPLFVMLSGALLLGRRETWDVFVKKRLMRILIPLLAWSAIFFLYRYFYHNHTFSLESVLKGLYSGHAYFHLWYFYMLFGLYLLLPLLRILVQHASKRELIYMILLWFFVVSLNVVTRKYFGFTTGIDLLNMAGYLGFFVGGYVIVNSKFSTRFFILSLVIFWVASLATIFGTADIVEDVEKYNEFFYNYRSWNVVLASFSFFIVLKYAADRWGTLLSKRGASLFAIISSASLGMYVFHVIPLEMLKYGSLGFTMHPAKSPPWFMIPAMVAVVFVSSLLVAIVLKNLPLVRRIV